jgi:hypothetical protein
MFVSRYYCLPDAAQMLEHLETFSQTGISAPPVVAGISWKKFSPICHFAAADARNWTEAFRPFTDICALYSTAVNVLSTAPESSTVFSDPDQGRNSWVTFATSPPLAGQSSGLNTGDGLVDETDVLPAGIPEKSRVWNAARV